MNSRRKRDLLTVDGLPAVAPFRFRHNRSMPEVKSERKPFVGFLGSSTYFSPHRRGFRLRIARRQQQLRLMRLQVPALVRRPSATTETSL